MNEISAFAAVSCINLFNSFPVTRGDFGRLGHGNSSDLFLPHSITVLQGLEIKQMSCGDSHCLAISSEGEVYRYAKKPVGRLSQC